MSNYQEFDILKLVELTRVNKYEMTAVGFAALDKIDKIDIPKKMKSRKFAVQALYAVSEKLVQYGYFTAEERKKLQDEANLSDSPYKNEFNNVFTKSAAPVVEEVTEEEDIPEEEVKPIKTFSEDDESGEIDSEEDSFDDDDDDEEESDEEDEK